MKKYVVLKEFLDRFSNMKHFRPGDIHEPPNEERAKQLIDLGFLGEEVKEETKEPKKVKGKGKGNENQ